MIGRLFVPLLIWSSVPCCLAQTEMVSRAYRLPSVFFKQIPQENLKPTAVDLAGAPVRAYDIRDWCESQGMKFPPGSCATYIEELGGLIILNTQDSLDIADTLFDGGCCGLPPWPLKSLLTLVSFPAVAVDSAKATPTYDELRKSAGESWDVVSSLEITSKANVSSSWSTTQPDRNLAKSDAKSGNGSSTIAKGKVKVDPAIHAWAIDVEASYQLRGMNNQPKPIDLSYEGKTFVEIDQSQVLQLLHGETTSYALILRVSWPLPGGEGEEQDLGAALEQEGGSVKKPD